MRYEIPVLKKKRKGGKEGGRREERKEEREEKRGERRERLVSCSKLLRYREVKIRVTGLHQPKNWFQCNRIFLKIDCRSTGSNEG